MNTLEFIFDLLPKVLTEPLFYITALITMIISVIVTDHLASEDKSAILEFMSLNMPAKTFFKAIGLLARSGFTICTAGIIWLAEILVLCSEIAFGSPASAMRLIIILLIIAVTVCKNTASAMHDIFHKLEELRQTYIDQQKSQKIAKRTKATIITVKSKTKVKIKSANPSFPSNVKSIIVYNDPPSNTEDQLPKMVGYWEISNDGKLELFPDKEPPIGFEIIE